MNNIPSSAFERWVFRPGMLFGAEEMWWRPGKRKKRHEGIDLSMYEDADGTLHYLDLQTAIPALYPGEVVSVRDDFIGRSIFLRHELAEKGRRLFTIYGHLNPLSLAASVPDGAAVGRIAPAKEKKIPPHAHISAALVPESFAGPELSWDAIATTDAIVLIDPAELII